MIFLSSMLFLLYSSSIPLCTHFSSKRQFTKQISLTFTRTQSWRVAHFFLSHSQWPGLKHVIQLSRIAYSYETITKILFRWKRIDTTLCYVYRYDATLLSPFLLSLSLSSMSFVGHVLGYVSVYIMISHQSYFAESSTVFAAGFATFSRRQFRSYAIHSSSSILAGVPPCTTPVILHLSGQVMADHLSC